MMQPVEPSAEVRPGSRSAAPPRSNSASTVSTTPQTSTNVHPRNDEPFSFGILIFCAMGPAAPGLGVALTVAVRPPPARLLGGSRPGCGQPAAPGARTG